MNNYYFTADKWYGPLDVKAYGKDHFNKGNSPEEYYLSLPSGPSLIPEFAGMVKEENKDFKWRWESDIIKCHCPCHVNTQVKHIAPCCNNGYIEMNKRKTAVPVAEEGKPLPKLDKPLISQDDLEAWEKEEGKQTFSESDMIGFAEWFHKNVFNCSDGYHIKTGDYSHTYEAFTGKSLLTEYLKTKQ